MRLSNYLPLKCGNKSCPATKCLWEELTCAWSDGEKTYHFWSTKSWSFILDSKEIKQAVVETIEETRFLRAGDKMRKIDSSCRGAPASWLKVTVRARTVRKIYRGLIHQLQRPFFQWKLRILIKTAVKSFCEWTRGRKGRGRSAGGNNEISVVKYLRSLIRRALCRAKKVSSWEME